MHWLGAFLIALGAFFAWRQHVVLSHSTVVRGTVVELVTTPTSRGGQQWQPAPKVSFRTLQGKKFSVTARAYFGRFTLGGNVNVAYVDANGSPVPGSVRLMRFSHRYGFAAWAIGLGLLCLFLHAGYRHGDGWFPKQYPAVRG